MLMNHPNSKVDSIERGFEPDLFSTNEDLTLIRLVLTEKDFHQGGFSSTIFPKNGVNLTQPYLKIDPIIGDHAWEPLRDASRFQYRVTTFYIFW
jgi:hypothetical protein